MATIQGSKGGVPMERKIISISAKRQITIPQKFYEALHFADEAECVVRGNELVIRPARVSSGGEFAEQILAELVREGLSGEALLNEFKRRQGMVSSAMEKMLSQADLVASGKGDYFTYDDIFGSED